MKEDLRMYVEVGTGGINFDWSTGVCVINLSPSNYSFSLSLTYQCSELR